VSIIGQLPRIEPEPWMESGLCAQVGGDLWFARKGEATKLRQAKAICRHCPHIKDCLNYAITHNERHGIWGATTEHDRRCMRHGRRCRGAFEARRRDV